MREKMTLPKRLQEKRDELAKTMGNRHANPVIRSMYPSKSRGQMAGEFSQLYSLGFSEACALLIPEIEKLREALRTKCMCYPSDDPRSGRNPCHACRIIQSWQEFLNGGEK